MNQKISIFWLAFSLWNFIMAFTFLGAGIYAAIKGETQLATLILILSMLKCFIFAMCVKELVTHFTRKEKGGNKEQ